MVGERMVERVPCWQTFDFRGWRMALEPMDYGIEPERQIST